MIEAGDVISLLDATLVDVTDLTDGSNAVTVLTAAEATDIVSIAILDAILVAADVTDGANISSLTDVTLLVIVDVALVPITIPVDVADASTILDGASVCVTDPVDNRLLSDVADVLEGITEAGDVISLPDAVLVTTIVTDGADVSSLTDVAFLAIEDVALVRILVTIPIEVTITDSVPTTTTCTVVDVADVRALLDTALVDVGDGVDVSVVSTVNNVMEVCSLLGSKPTDDVEFTVLLNIVVIYVIDSVETCS